MKRVFLLAIAASLSACAGTGRLDWCKYADARRTTYTATIRAADAWAASGRPMPREMVIAREGAVALLGVLDTRCPVAG